MPKEQFPRLLGAIPSAVSDIADKSSRLGSIATALSAKNHVLGKLDQISEFSSQADHVVAVCQWLYDALESNGVSRNKLILSRQGLNLLTLTLPQSALYN